MKTMNKLKIKWKTMEKIEVCIVIVHENLEILENVVIIFHFLFLFFWFVGVILYVIINNIFGLQREAAAGLGF